MSDIGSTPGTNDVDGGRLSSINSEVGYFLNDQVVTNLEMLLPAYNIYAFKWVVEVEEENTTSSDDSLPNLVDHVGP